MTTKIPTVVSMEYFFMTRASAFHAIFI